MRYYIDYTKTIQALRDAREEWFAQHKRTDDEDSCADCRRTAYDDAFHLMIMRAIQMLDDDDATVLISKDKVI